MERHEVRLSKPSLKRLRAKASKCTDVQLLARYRIIVLSAEGWSRPRIAAAVGWNVASITQVRKRWLSEGEAGLIDKREDNGPCKVTDHYAAMLRSLTRDRSTDWGHRRPTWTLRLLIQTMARLTGITVSATTMSRLLKTLRVRSKVVKALTPCPWSDKARKRRMKQVHRVIARLKPDEAAVWEDETDIDLNPRIGRDWMPAGMRRTVMTPGKNVKHQFAAAMDAQTGRLVWAESARKNSGLFIALLGKLLKRYQDKRVVHVILDNFKIHKSRQVWAWMTEFGERIRLHFLPPYSPDDNRIEAAVWTPMHKAVTYNHAQESIHDLVAEVRAWLIRTDRRAMSGVAESRKAV
jgi:transposase